MITLVRTAGIHDGKFQEASSLATKFADYLNQKVEGVNCQAVRSIGGPLYQVHWIVTYPSLAALEKVTKQLAADEGYLALVAEGRRQGVFIGSSMVDSIYETLS